MKSLAWPRALARLFPRGVVAMDTATLEAHAGDAWFARALPQAVVFPRRAEDVAEVLKFANGRRIPVTARGAGRGYVGGCVPRRGGIVISFARMNRVLELNKADGVAVVQPGVITGELQAMAWKQGLFYPHRSGEPERVLLRRKRGNERGRAALPEIWSHAQLRAWAAGGAGGRHAGPRRRTHGKKQKRVRPGRHFCGRRGSAGTGNGNHAAAASRPTGARGAFGFVPGCAHRGRLCAAHILGRILALGTGTGRPLHA